MSSFKGDVAQVSIANILQALFLNGQEGVLAVTDGKSERKIRVLKLGIRPLAARPDDPDILRHALVKEKILTPAELNNAMSGWDPSARYPGDFLLRRRVISTDQVENQIRHQLEELLYEIFMSPDLHYEFDAGEEALDHEIFDPDELGNALLYSVNGVLMEVARRQDEWQRMREIIPTEMAIFTVTNKGLPRSVPSESELPESTYGQVARLLASGITVRRMARESTLSSYKVHDALFRLYGSGYARPLSREEKRELAAKLGTQLKRREALEVYESLLAEDAGDIEARAQLVALLEKERGAGEELIRHYMELVERLEAVDPARTLAHVQKILQIDPFHLEALEKLIHLQAVAGNPGAALAAVRAVVRSTKAKERYELGAAILMRALNFFPEETPLYHEIAEFFAVADQNEAAIDCLNAVASIYKKRQDYARLRKTLECILRLDPDAGGRARKMLGELKKSRRSLGQKLKVAAWAGLALAVAAGTVHFVSLERLARRALAETESEVRTHLGYGRTDRARESITTFRKRYPFSLALWRLSRLRREVATAERELARQMERTKEERLQELSEALVRARVLDQSRRWREEQELLERKVLETQRFLEEGRPGVDSTDRKHFDELLAKATLRLEAINERLARIQTLQRRIERAEKERDVAAWHRHAWELYEAAPEPRKVAIPLLIHAAPVGTVVYAPGEKRLGSAEPAEGLLVTVGPTPSLTLSFRRSGYKTAALAVDPRQSYQVQVTLEKDAVRLDADGAIDAVPAEWDGKVFCATRNGVVHCWGEDPWPPFTVPATDVYNANVDISGGIQVWNGTLYFGSHNGLVYLVDARTGTPRERRFIQPLPRNRTLLPIAEAPSPASPEGVFAVNAGGRFISFLSLASGSLLQAHEVPAPAIGPPRREGELVYSVTRDRRLWEFLPDGALRRVLDLPGSAAAAAIARTTGPEQARGVAPAEALLHWTVSQGKLFTAAAGGTVEALDLASGRRLWSRPFGSQLGPLTASVEKDVLIVSADGGLTGAGPLDGRERWTTRTPGSAGAEGVLHLGSLYIGTRAGYILCIDTASGKIVWSFETRGARAAQRRGISSKGLVSRGGSYHQGSDDGHFYKLTLE